MNKLEEKLGRCLEITEKCINKARVNNSRGEKLIKFTKDYYKDAEHYKEEQPETALEAVSYAHGLLDAGVLLGHIEIPDYELDKQVFE